MILEIPPIGVSPEHDAILRGAAREVTPDELRSESVQRFITDIKETLTGRGVGLAAPQAGRSVRIAALCDTQEFIDRWPRTWVTEHQRFPFSMRVLVNPRLQLGSDTHDWYEACLSNPGHWGLVRRALRVRVEALDERGNLFVHEAHDWEARIYQHECDHLDGRLCFEKFLPGSEVTDAEYRRMIEDLRDAEDGSQPD